jgi:hypothetical protein
LLTNFHEALGSRLDQLKARETKVTVGSDDGDGDELAAARAPRSFASGGAVLFRLRFLLGAGEVATESALGDDGGELAGELESSGEGQMCPFFGS